MDEDSYNYPYWAEQINKDDIKANTILTKKLIRNLPHSIKNLKHKQL